VGFVRKFLFADGLLASVQRCLNREIFHLCQSPDPWEDCIMSGLAVFGFKFPFFSTARKRREFRAPDFPEPADVIRRC